MILSANITINANVVIDTNIVLLINTFSFFVINTINKCVYIWFLVLLLLWLSFIIVYMYIYIYICMNFAVHVGPQFHDHRQVHLIEVHWKACFLGWGFVDTWTHVAPCGLYLD